MKLPQSAAVMLALLASWFLPAVHATTISAGSNTVNVDDVFTIPISITDAVDLIHWQFDIAFDPAVLEANSVAEGPFLSSSGTDITLFGPGVIDNVSGHISLVTDSCIFCFSGPGGNGVLADIEFHALAIGQTPLTLSNVFVNDLDSGFSVVNGSVCVTQGSAECVAQPPGGGIPEPSTLLLLLAALAAFSVYVSSVRRRCAV